LGPLRYRATARTFSDKDRLQHLWVDQRTKGAASRAGFPAPDQPLDTVLHWQFARLTAPALAPLTRATQHAARSVLRQT
jgi:hypothetical protein